MKILGSISPLFLMLLWFCQSQNSSSSNSSTSSSSSISTSSSSSISTSSSNISTSSSNISMSSGSSTTSSGSSSTSSGDSSTSNSSCTIHTTCTSCFESNCAWDFVGATCKDGSTKLPFPLEFLDADSTFCNYSDCLQDINPPDDHYEKLFQEWKDKNSAALTKLSKCLEDISQGCDDITWDNKDYESGCTTNANSAELCDYDATLNNTNMTIASHRVLLQTNNSSSSSSSVTPTSDPSKSSSSVTPTSNPSISSSSVTPTSNTSSSVTPSSSSSSPVTPSSSSSSPVTPSSSSSSTDPVFALKQSYCIPSTCKNMIDHFAEQIFRNLLNISSTTEFENPKIQCSPKPTPKPSSLSGGAIAGIVIGCLVGVLLLGFLGWNVCGKTRDSNEFQAM